MRYANHFPKPSHQDTAPPIYKDGSDTKREFRYGDCETYSSVY